MEKHRFSCLYWFSFEIIFNQYMRIFKILKILICVYWEHLTHLQHGGLLSGNVPYGLSNQTTQSERRGAEEKPWPLAVYKAFPRLWTHWTEVLQRFYIKSISNVTAMHNSPQILISPRKLILCATANELSLLSGSTAGWGCCIHGLVV